MKVRNSHHAIANVFVFLLLGLFAVMGTVEVLFGALSYRSIVARSETDSVQWLVSSTIRHKVRAADRAGQIAVETLDGVDVLVLGDPDNQCVTYLYTCDGELRELYLEAGEPFDPEMGEMIRDGVAGFSLWMDGQELTIEIQEELGNDQHITMMLYAAGGAV